MDAPTTDDLRRAIAADDRPAIGVLLAEHPDLRAALNEPMFIWDTPALAAARSIETAELMLGHGGDLGAVAAWWAPGIGLSGKYDLLVPDVLRHYARRGAALTAHAAASLGLVDELAAILDADPDAIRAPGIDDCTPLHFAFDPATAALLLERGADIDARDTDHDSTPAQWLIGDRPETARYLLERGATPDVFLAAALGDAALVRRLVDDGPACLALRIGRAPFHPIGYENLGGTVLQWSLAFNSYPHQIAWSKGHRELFEWMYEASDDRTKLLVACTLALRDRAEALVAARPGLVADLPDDDLILPALYCWETNASLEAVRLMLDLGFPIDVPERRHGWSTLHNAAWGGYADLVDLLLERGYPADARDPDHDSTPLGWALHCCLEDGRHPEGEYGRVVDSLIRAGCPWDRGIHPTGNVDVDAALAKHV